MYPAYGNATPVRTEQIILSDGRGEFAVSPDSTVTVLSGYPNVGTVFIPNTAQHAQVLANLAAVADNAARIKAFTGVSPAAASSSVTVYQAGGSQTVPATMVGEVAAPLWKRPWFLALTGTVVVGVIAGGIVYSARRS